MGRLMGLGELCEPMQTCNCSNPMKKRPLLLESFYGAGDGNSIEFITLTL